MTYLSSYLYLIKLERLLNIIWPLAYSKKILPFSSFLSSLLFSLSFIRLTHFNSLHSLQLFIKNSLFQTVMRILFFLAKPKMWWNEIFFSCMFPSYSSKLLPEKRNYFHWNLNSMPSTFALDLFYGSECVGSEVARYSWSCIVSR